MIKESKRKIYFDPKYRKLKRHRLIFFCPVFNNTLSGCDLTCNPCLALKYSNEIRVVHVDQEEFDVYIGRGSKWGNKFVIGVDGTREEVIEKYKVDFLEKPWLHNDAVRQLQGRVLGCHCKPLPCHGDFLVEFVRGKTNGNLSDYFSNTEDAT